MPQELKQRIETLEYMFGLCSNMDGFPNGHAENAIELIKELTEREAKAVKTLKKIAARKNIKISELEGQPYNWQMAEATLKELGE